MRKIEALERLRDELNSRGESNDMMGLFLHDHEVAMQLIASVYREVDERFMELPVDADGVPIHMGDSVEGELLLDNATVRGTVRSYHIHDDDEPGTVYIRVKPTENTWTIKELQFRRCRHVKPRTLEDVLGEYASQQHGITTEEHDELIVRYAAEIRELLGVDA